MEEHRLRVRRVAARWPRRRCYEVQELDDSGAVVREGRTASLLGVLTRRGVHTTDQWDWVHAADDAFDRGDASWIDDPFRRP